MKNSVSNKAPDLIKIELLIATLLRWGVLVCGVVLSISWLLSLFTRPIIPWTHFQTLPPRGSEELTEGLAHFSGLTEGNPTAWMAFGLFLLILIPIFRVAASLVIFIKQRDAIFILLSLIVFSVLCLGLFLGKAL